MPTTQPDYDSEQVCERLAMVPLQGERLSAALAMEAREVILLQRAELELLRLLKPAAPPAVDVSEERE